MTITPRATISISNFQMSALTAITTVLACRFIIDPKTNAEIASIPTRLYYQKRWFKFQLYMQASLDEVGQKIQVEVTGTAPRK